tara:strand:- start:8538 stop:9776 length:1239 start_codon:yes stop_codon:yes gene_type:complete
MRILLFSSDSKGIAYLSPIHVELLKRGHESFFLYNPNNLTAYPKSEMEKYMYDSSGTEYDFKGELISDTLNIPLPFKPQYLIVHRERWDPEQSVLREFKEKFNTKIILVEVNTQIANVIESRLEAISRTKYPQSDIDLFFDHSDFCLENRKKLVDFDGFDKSIVVGNPCYDNNILGGVNNEVYEKYGIDKNKKQILFYGLINMDRNIAFELLENLSDKITDDYQIHYKPFPGEPFNSMWMNDFLPDFRVKNVNVIRDHFDLFSMYSICDIHIGVIGSVMYPPLLMNKKVVNINNHCTYLDRGNDVNVYLEEDSVGAGDGSAKFWMRVHELETIDEFKNLVDFDRIELFKKDNERVKDIINKGTYNYDYDLKFLTDESKKDYSELLKLFDDYNDGMASNRIVTYLEENELKLL